MTFSNRRDAGRTLGAEVARLDVPDPVVIALPRGGVPVAAEVARALDAPLDVLVVRKLGCPWQPELGMGAIAEGGIRVLNRDLVARLGVTDDQIEEVAAREEVELRQRVERYRGDRSPVPLSGRTAVLVDDGLATGFTARSAVAVLRRKGAARVVLAVPVAPEDTLAEMARVADEVVCLESPEWFLAIGAHYDDFSQTGNEEVRAILASSRDRAASADPGPESGDPGTDVTVPVGDAGLPGRIEGPVAARGLVLFAHGSGSGRTSPRNNRVARVLHEAGFRTLLFDLLTAEEAGDRRNVFDVALLGSRLSGASGWLAERPESATLPIGYFGASTGAAAALQAAAEPGSGARAIVCRGGRPDLAEPVLAEVRAPTLLIVGEQDEEVLELNVAARERLRCPTRLEVVPGATHLFEEPGALERVAELACDWFAEHLGPE